MVDYQIPITRVVNASAVLPSAGVEPLKLSTILLLTNDEQVTPLEDEYMIARNAMSIGQAFGTTTTTYKMASAIFGQNPNVLANDGYVIVAPLLTGVEKIVTPATAGTLTTVDLSTNIANFAGVEDGDLTVGVDSVSQELTGLDCSGVTTIDDLAALLQENLTGVVITVEDNKLVFTSETTGSTSNVTLSATVDGSGTDLYGATYLNGSAATEIAGQNAQTVIGDEEFSAAIDRIAQKIYFEGVLTTKTFSTAECIAASATIQGLQNRLLFLPSESMDAIGEGGLFEQLQSNFYTKCLLYTKADAEAAKVFAAAYASRLLAVNYGGYNTTLTMNLKDLAGIQADTNISETILNKCEILGVDCFPSIEGLPKVMSFKNTYFIDQVANMIWLVNAIQTNVFNVLAQTRTKIPQTEEGISYLTNACRQICTQAVRNGYIAAGKWNSSDTFGDLEDFHRNVEEFGYYIYHQPVAEQAQSERQQRKAPLIQIACKEAGAIHSANILIYIEP